MVRFVTNTTKESKKDLLERLKKLEFDISEDEIFTSLTAARNLVEQKQVRPMLLVDDRALPDFKGRGNLERFKNRVFTASYKSLLKLNVSKYLFRFAPIIESKLVFL